MNNTSYSNWINNTTKGGVEAAASPLAWAYQQSNNEKCDLWSVFTGITRQLAATQLASDCETWMLISLCKRDLN